MGAINKFICELPGGFSFVRLEREDELNGLFKCQS